MKLLIFLVILIIVVVMLLRVWYHRDERALQSKWRALSSSATVDPPPLNAQQLDGLPEATRRFFKFSIQNHTPLYTLVEITMHGEMSLGDKSMPRYKAFHACQLLAPPLGFIWRVKAGTGIMSPASLLPSESVVWKEIDSSTALVKVTQAEFEQEYMIRVDAGGHLEQVQFQRWSDANADRVYRYQPFGGYLSDFQNFGGFTLPTSVEAGNHFGTDEYFPFFKARVDSVKFVTASQAERTCLIDS